MTVTYRFRDADGDKLVIFPADIPGVGAGVNIRTTTFGASVSLQEIPALIDGLRRVADYAATQVEVPS